MKRVITTIFDAERNVYIEHCSGVRMRTFI